MKWLSRFLSPVADPADDARETIADLRARLDASEKERRKLTRTIVKMKVAGGSIPRAVPAGARLEQRDRTPFQIAVEANPRCASNPGLRRHLLAWADREKERGVDDKVILEKLSTWNVVQVTDDDDDEDDDEKVAI